MNYRSASRLPKICFKLLAIFVSRPCSARPCSARCDWKQFASIWEHLNDFRLWTFQKSAAGAAEVTDNEAAPAPAPLTHGVITGPITQVTNLRFSLMKMEISRVQILIFAYENGDITRKNLTISLMKMRRYHVC